MLLWYSHLYLRISLALPHPFSCHMQSVPRSHLWPVDNDSLRRTKLRSLQLRKSTLKPPWTAPSPDHPTRPGQPAFRPCPEAGSCLGIRPILLSHLCLRGPRMGPTPCLLTLTGIGPQTHRSTILALASALFWYFYFWYIILNSFVKPNHWIQSNAMECLPWDWSFSKCPLSSQQALLYPGDGSLFPRKAQVYVGTFFSNYKAAEWVSWRFSSSFSPRLSIPVLVMDGTLLSAGSAVRVGVEQYRIKPTMMMVKDRM